MTATDPDLIVDAEIIEEITEPGVYDGIPEDVYHADPVPGGSLSASGAKLLLPPGCPARYWHDRCNPPPPKPVYERGTAAHKVVLGTGPELVLVDAPDWRTKKAQQQRDEARERGAIPMLPDAWAEIHAMADAIRKHPIASALLDPGRGRPEQSMFWIDDDTGIWRRARLDFLPDPAPGRRLIIPDYKTCDNASEDAVRRAIGNYGYNVQAAQYTDGAAALGLDPDPAFLFIFQEKRAPYLIHVIGLDDVDIGLGRARMAAACEIWRDCTTAGYWPGYGNDDITYITLPPWAARPIEDILQ